MTVQDPQVRLGWLTLSTLDDARRSSITGTTLNGPNGSAQFMWVYGSSISDFQFRLGSTTLTPSTVQPVVGILQDTPGPGLAGSICVGGITKALAGSTVITRYALLQTSSTTGGQGQLVPYLTGNGPPVGYAMETPTAVNQVFAAFLFWGAHGGYST